MELENNERDMLLVVLNQYLEGMADTREEMIRDTVTLDTLDAFSDTIQQHDIDTQVIESIRQKVLQDGTD